MMGTLEDNHDALVDKTTGGVIVLPGRPRAHPPPPAGLASRSSRIGQSACDQCSFCTELCPRWLLGHPIEPHRAMRSLGFNLVGEANTAGTSFCCECNLCSLYSCPEDLDPKNVCTQNKRRLAAEKKRWENPAVPPPPRRNPPRQPQGPHGTPDPEARAGAVPQRRAVARGAARGQHGGHQAETTRRRTLPVHRPARPAGDEGPGGGPAAGDRRQAGPRRPVHASIDGAVTAIRDGVVWIQKL